MAFSKKIERQIKKVFGDTLSAGTPVTYEKTQDFFTLVDSTYDQYEDRLKILGRNLEISSQELNLLNGTTHSMLDSLGQGFLVFDKHGICSATYSRATENLLEVVPGGKNILEVLRISEKEKEEIKLWIQMMFEERISFNELATLGPQKFSHSKNLSIHLEFKPIRSFDSKIENVMLICTDRTNEETFRAQMREKEDYVHRIIKLIKEKNNVLRFLDFCSETLAELENRQLSLIDFKRKVHTIKGGAASFSMSDFRKYLEDFETKLQEDATNYQDQTKAFIQTSLFHINNFKNEYSFILSDAEKNKENPQLEISKSDLIRFLDELKNHTQLKQTFIETFLKVPIMEMLRSYDLRLLSLAKELSKKIRPVQIEAEEFRINPDRYGPFFNSLIHVFRNSLDHGIEEPEERIKSGKPEEGFIQIKANRRSQQGVAGFEIAIGDDGRGIDTDRLRAKLLKSDVTSSTLTEKDLLQRIMVGNLSSRDNVTEYSGRGVGVSAVHAEVLKCGGTIEIENNFGQGVSFKIFLPFLD